MRPLQIEKVYEGLIYSFSISFKGHWMYYVMHEYLCTARSIARQTCLISQTFLKPDYTGAAAKTRSTPRARSQKPKPQVNFRTPPPFQARVGDDVVNEWTVIGNEVIRQHRKPRQVALTPFNAGRPVACLCLFADARIVRIHLKTTISQVLAVSRVEKGHGLLEAIWPRSGLL